MDLTEAEDIKKRWQEYTELYKEELHDQDNHDGVIIRKGNSWRPSWILSITIIFVLVNIIF